VESSDFHRVNGRIKRQFRCLSRSGIDSVGHELDRINLQLTNITINLIVVESVVRIVVLVVVVAGVVVVLILLNLRLRWAVV
jgi:hypothetical protein